jgi:hypothetical protein
LYAGATDRFCAKNPSENAISFKVNQLQNNKIHLSVFHALMDPTKITDDIA